MFELNQELLKQNSKTVYSEKTIKSVRKKIVPKNKIRILKYFQLDIQFNDDGI